tara:strand:+ start:223 stop:339 length:117 start_codon:yes stop_codon:yes gene_type:complete
MLALAAGRLPLRWRPDLGAVPVLWAGFGLLSGTVFGRG